MPRHAVSALAVLALYAFGIEAAVAYVLAGADGLAELHKTVLVGFMIGFPVLSLAAAIPLALRQARAAPAGADPAEADPTEADGDLPPRAAFRRAAGLGPAE